MTEPAEIQVWVYLDPASGIEVYDYDDPGIGRLVHLPADLLHRFRSALAAYEAVAEEVRDASGL